MTPQLIAVLCYRISNLYHTNNIGGNSKDVISLIARAIGQIEIFYSSEIGKGLKINHGIGTVIGARVKIGENCLLHQNITLGDKGGGRPTIGNNVTIYAGAKVLGDISIGDNSIIAANAVVIKSCPENSVLIGLPAKNFK